MIARYRIMVASFLVLTLMFCAFQAHLTFGRKEFLQTEGEKRSNRYETVAAHRGIIFDRNGQPLAISTPVFTAVADPSVASWNEGQMRHLANILGLSVDALAESLRGKAESGSRYLRLARRLTPGQANEARALGLVGLIFEREYRRFYPAGEATAHLVGTTNHENLGLEGVELAYDRTLAQKAGKRRVLRNRQGKVVKNLGYVEMPRFGDDLVLSVDLVLQHHAHAALADAVLETKAESASLVMLDVHTGEVLALVNQPSFNPNSAFSGHFARKNRAVTDAYEPGSTVKPFVALAALRNRVFRPESVIDTNPGYFPVGRKLVEDPRNYGELTLTGVIAKSSQVGISKVALSLHDTAVFEVLERVGLGVPPMSGLPYEDPGLLEMNGLSSRVVRATLAYGYGLTVSPMQLAVAYLTLATGGVRIQPTIFNNPNAPLDAERIFAKREVVQVMRMLEQVISPQGTAWAAKIPGYKVAGKTGTVRKVGQGGYDESRHATWFVGMVPARAPRFVVVVLVDEPKTYKPSGGSVSAPVFAEVASLAVHRMGIPPAKGA